MPIRDDGRPGIPVGAGLEQRLTASGPGEVLQLVRSGAAPTRRDVLELTGLSRVTVAQRIDFLLESGLIREAGARATGGRRASTLEFNVNHSVILCAALDTRHARVAITRLDGHIVADRQVCATVSQGPEAALGVIGDAFDELIAESGQPIGRIGAIGMSIPGPVDPQSKRPSQPPIMPGWDAFPIADVLTDRFEVPVFVENDADAMAYGEQATNFPTSPALCMVKVSTGIGAGIIIKGSVYHGIDGGAGDIGHIKIPHVDEVCQCGAVGCLAAVASGGAIAKSLKASGAPAESGRDVRELLAEGDVAALRLTHEAGGMIGNVLAAVVSTLNPGILLVGGDLSSSSLLAGIREGLYPRTLARATRNLEVKLSTLGDDAGIVGLSQIAVGEIYAPRAVNARFVAQR